MAGPGGGTPVIRYDLVKHGTVTAVISATQFRVDELAGYPDGYFASSGIIVGWGIYVLRDTRSTLALVAPPQGEQTFVLTSANDGTITHLAFTVPMIVGDEILLLHPNISAAWIAALATQNVPAIDSLVDLLLRDVVGNKADTPNSVIDDTSSLMRYVKALLAAPPITPTPGGVTLYGSVNAAWFAAAQDLLTIGVVAAGTATKINFLGVGIQNLVGNITIRMYCTINGVERRIYPIPSGLTFSVAADAPCIAVINGTMVIPGRLRVTVQSDNVLDNAQAVTYEAV